ncbi:MAG: protein kinase [Verrucomicrobiales bacterium]|nr:protein kinase [Verrucomicrobiales bacterium]
MRLPELPGHTYEDLLGEDPFGWSFVTTYGDSERRVVKVLKSQATNDSLLHQYFATLSKADDLIEGAATVYDYTLGDEDSPAAYSMPFYGWRGKENKKWQLTSLKRLMHLLPTEQAEEIIRKLAVCVAEVHEADLFHGGLKVGDIFLTGDEDGNQQVKIADFGQIFMGGLQYLEAGELLFYVSPEQLENGDFSNDLGKRWDIYSFGVVAFQLLTGHLPRLDQLRQQCLEHPGLLDETPAIAYGGLTSTSEHFLQALEVEKPVEWPDSPSDDKEKAVREVIEHCLEFDHRNRPESMKVVAESLAEALKKLPLPSPRTEPIKVVKSTASAQCTDSRVMPPSDGVDVDSFDEEAEFQDTAEHSEESTVTDSGEFDEDDASGEIQVLDKSAEKSSIGTADEETEDHGKVWRYSPKARVDRYFADHPHLKWKIGTIASLTALFTLLLFAAGTMWKADRTKRDLTIEAAQLQASVEKQADAYRRVLTETQQNEEQLESELNEVEGSRSRLMGEAKLARQILRQTQDNGDEFFQLVLDNRDTDVPGFREKRAAAMADARGHYERLIEVYGDAPDFIVSTANALFYLGRIYRETGEFGKSLAAFGEAERRYVALLDDADDPEVEFVRNLAIAKNALGGLAFGNAEFPTARHYYTESSRYWAEVRAISSGDALDAAISIHENSLLIVECEFAINRLEAALDGARSIGNQLLSLQEQNEDNHRLVGALGKSFSLAGRILEATGDGELAKEAFEQAGNLYAKAVKLNAAIDAYQLGLGNSLARVGLLENDIEKLESAVEVLGVVISSNPYEPSFQKTLADVYGVLARNQRDGGRAENAIQLEKEAIDILQPIIRSNPSSVPADVLYSYSQRLAHLAELLGDSGDFDDSRVPLQEAIVVLEKLSRSDRALAQYNRALARARGLAGFACLKSGDKSEAKEHLELAKAEWENYMESNPEDSDAVQAVRWASDQLRGLQ